MKLLLLFIGLPVLVFGQATIDPVTKKVYLNEVHEVIGSSDTLNRKATEWIAKTYNNSNYVTRLNENDKILVKGGFDVGATMSNYGTSLYVKNKVDYTLDLEFKDGRYKIEIYDVLFEKSESGQSLSMYLMDYEGYKTMLYEFYSDYDGPGKKRLIKNLNDDDKLRKQHKGMQDYGKEVLSQIYDQLNALDIGLLSYMLSEQSKKDDW